MPDKFTFKEIEQKLEWISDCAARIGNYENFQNRLIGLKHCVAGLNSKINGLVLKEAINSGDLFSPVGEVLHLYEIFKFIDSDKASRIPRKVIKSLLSSNSDPRFDQLNDHGRNHQFELQWAAILNSARIRITGFEDVECVTKSGVEICFQCKRPQSAKKITDNIVRACEQLKTNNGVGGRKFGAVVICLDLIVESNKKHYFDTPKFIIDADLNRIRESFVSQSNSILRNETNNGVIGAVGILNYLIWESKTGSLLPQISIFTAPKPNNKASKEVLENFTKQLMRSIRLNSGNEQNNQV